jgi:hypothetical protein
MVGRWYGQWGTEEVVFTLSGNPSSTPFGAAFCTLSGTLEAPFAWDFPWPNSFVLMRKGEVANARCWMRVRASTRRLVVEGMTRVIRGYVVVW